ncbi:MAG: DUF4291 domain-containing protein [Candidatus Sericytochromatia bacterium]
MPEKFEIRADFDKDTIVVYQAYNEKIASNAIKNNKFVEPFSFNRMTWIKPSFLWLMERSNYGQKSNQEYTLAIRIKRSGWEKALEQAVLTHPEKSVYKNAEIWKEDFDKAQVHVQWDPERSIRGSKLDYWTIQVGISRELIKTYNDEWILEINDYSTLVKKIYSLCKEGKYDKAKDFLPKEKVYELPEKINKKIGIV